MKALAFDGLLQIRVIVHFAKATRRCAKELERQRRKCGRHIFGLTGGDLRCSVSDLLACEEPPFHVRHAT